MTWKINNIYICVQLLGILMIKYIFGFNFQIFVNLPTYQNIRPIYHDQPTNQFKSATLLSATHECTPKIWAKHERHSFQNWRVQIERHSFLGVSEVKECTLLKNLRIYRLLTNLLNFFCATRKMKDNKYYCQYCHTANVNNGQLKHYFQCILSFFYLV